MRPHVIDAPDRPVEMHPLDIRRREMHRDERRIRPVQQPRWQPVMLRHRQPVPDAIAGNDIPMGVLPEIPDKVPLDCWIVAAQPYKAAFEFVRCVRKTPERQIRTEPLDTRHP